METLPPETFEPLLTEVGRSLQNFSGIEWALDYFFGAILSSDTLFESNIIMASIVSFEARVKVCRNLVLMRPLRDDHLNLIWTKLAERMLKQLKQRNELAHFRTISLTIGKGKTFAALVPYYSSGKFFLDGQKDQRPGTHLTLAQIKERGKAFSETAGAMDWLTSQIERKPFRRFAAPANDLVRHLQSLAAQNLEEPPSPPQPSEA